MEVDFKPYSEDFSVINLRQAEVDNGNGNINIYLNPTVNAGQGMLDVSAGELWTLYVESDIGEVIELAAIKEPLQNEMEPRRDIPQNVNCCQHNIFLFPVNARFVHCRRLHRYTAFSVIFDRNNQKMTIYDSNNNDHTRPPYVDIKFRIGYSVEQYYEDKKKCLMRKKDHVATFYYHLTFTGYDQVDFNDDLISYEVFLSQDHNTRAHIPVTADMAKNGSYILSPFGIPAVVSNNGRAVDIYSGV